MLLIGYYYSCVLNSLNLDCYVCVCVGGGGGVSMQMLLWLLMHSVYTAIINCQECYDCMHNELVMIIIANKFLFKSMQLFSKKEDLQLVNGCQPV